MHTIYCVTYFSSATACVNTREHISARQCQGHCRGQNRQNPDAAPLHACPTSKTTHGVLTTRTAIHTTARFHISQVSARRSTLLYCDWHTECAHQPSPTTTSHTLHSLPRGTIHTSAVTTPMETRCQPNVATPVVLPRPPDSLTEKESGSADTFSLTGSSTNYKCSALVTELLSFASHALAPKL